MRKQPHFLRRFAVTAAVALALCAGVSAQAASLVPLGMSQCSLFEDAARGQKAQKLETTVDFLRCKYGGDIIDRGIKVMHKDLFQSAAENRRTHIENPFKGVAL